MVHVKTPMEQLAVYLDNRADVLKTRIARGNLDGEQEARLAEIEAVRTRLAVIEALCFVRSIN